MRSLFCLLILTLWLCSCDNDSPENPEIIDISTETEKEASIPAVSEPAENSGSVKIKVSVFAEGQRSVSSKVSGKITEGDVRLKNGEKFQAGDLLFMIDNQIAFEKYTAAKSDLKQSLSGLTDISSDGKKLLSSFNESITPSGLLPPFPDLQYVTRKTSAVEEIIKEYEAAAALENALKNYFILAEKDGVIAEVVKNPGKSAVAGETVLIVSSTGRRYLKTKDLSIQEGKTIQLYNSAEKLLMTFKSSDIRNDRIFLPNRIKPGNDYYIIISN